MEDSTTQTKVETTESAATSAPVQVEKKETEQGSSRRSSSDSRDYRGSDGDDKPYQNRKYQKYKKKYCHVCASSELIIDYKNHELLLRYVTNRGKILPKRVTGNCAKHQRFLSREIKKSRSVGLMPFRIS